MRIPKINSIHYGAQWIGISLVVGVLIPLVIWGLFHVIWWWLVIAGCISLGVFLIGFVIEMKQDFGKTTHDKKHLKDAIPYDPETQYPVIKSSICTGEKVAGFRNKSDGRMIEVMLIRSDADKAYFMDVYGLEKVDTEY